MKEIIMKNIILINLKMFPLIYVRLKAKNTDLVIAIVNFMSLIDYSYLFAITLNLYFLILSCFVKGSKNLISVKPDFLKFNSKFFLHINK